MLDVDNVQHVPVDALLQRMGTVRAERWPDVCRALAHVIAR